MRELLGTCYLLVSLLGGGLALGACVRFGWLKWLTVPIDGGRTWRGKRIFGDNKTYRGVIAVALGNAVVWGLQVDVLHTLRAFRSVELFDYSTVNGWFLGFTIGCAAMLAELPNSWIKRRYGLPPAGVARGGERVFFYVLDQVDLMAGVWFVLCFVMPVRLRTIALSLGLALLVHPATARLGFALSMRDRRR